MQELIYVEDNDGKTALMRASKGGFTAIVEHLINANANVNTIDNDGRTALMWASFGGNTAIVEHLLDAGADMSMNEVAMVKPC